MRTWGSYGASSPSGDTCLGIAGTGARYVFTLPTVEGSVTVEDVFSWQVGTAPGGTGVPAVGTWNGETSSGPAFLVTPGLGDCVTSPLTVAHLEGVGLFPA